MADVNYAGFWLRVGASLIDTLLVVLIVSPVLSLIYGQQYWQGGSFIYGIWDFLLSWVFPAIAVITFWIFKSATPGKLLLRLSIVDAKTGEKPTTGQLVGRYFAYYISAIPLLLGLFWVAIDKKKQGWHDMLARTVVIRNATTDPEPLAPKR